MTVTESEVIWSMEGFKDEGPEKKKWTEFRFPLNIICLIFLIFTCSFSFL